MKLPLTRIRADGGTQTRAELSLATVSQYRDDMEEGASFPPIVVFYDGTDHWLADGFHRFEASRAFGLPTIETEIRQGTQRDAVLYGVGANGTHGLRRTNADKRRAVETLLHDDEWRGWADREIARRCGVGNKFVGDVRASICVRNTDTPPTPRKVERSGTIYEQKPRAPAAVPAPKRRPRYEPPPRPGMSPEFADPNRVASLVAQALAPITALMERWPDDLSLRPLINLTAGKLSQMEVIEAGKEKRRRENDAA